MTLSRLVGLELNVLQKELKEKQKAVLKYNKILSNKNEMKKEIIKELLSLKEKYGASRKTEIVDAVPVEIKEKEEEEIPVVVLVDKFYYVHCVDASVYKKSADTINSDYRYIIYTTNKGKVSIFCNSGKAHIVKVQDIPYGKIKDKGQPLDNISNYNSKVENVVGITNIADNKYIFISSDGFIKVVNMSEFNVIRKSIDATKLKDGSSLVSVLPYIETGQIVLSTKKGIYIRFKQNEIPLQKKNAVGATGIKLADGDSIVMASVVEDMSTEIPFGSNKIEAEKIKITRRGGKGVKPRIS